HAGTARRQAVNAVAGPVPERDSGRTTFAVEPIQDMRTHGRIVLHRVGQQCHLSLIEQLACDSESLFVKFRDLLRAQAAGHDMLRSIAMPIIGCAASRDKSAWSSGWW